MTLRASLFAFLLGGCAAVTSATGFRPGAAGSSGATGGGQPGGSASGASSSGDADVVSGQAGATEMVMPDLTGMTPPQVWKALRAAGHVGNVSFSAKQDRRSEFLDGVAVVDHAPPAGEVRDPNRKITVLFDLPNMSDLLVPPVTGMTAADALAALAASGIVDVDLETSGPCRTDRVCERSPGAGILLIVGAPGNPAPSSEPAVALAPIDAPPMREVVVPDVGGMSYVEAWSALEAVRHEGSVRFNRAYQPHARPTSISLLTPFAAGSRIRADHAIDIKVSAPPSDGVVVPSLVGKPAADAIAALAAAGVIEIDVARGLNVGRDCKPGVVCTQEPAAGQTSDRVTLTLGFRWGATTRSPR